MGVCHLPALLGCCYHQGRRLALRFSAAVRMFCALPPSVLFAERQRKSGGSPLDPHRAIERTTSRAEGRCRVAASGRRTAHRLDGVAVNSRQLLATDMPPHVES